MLHCCHCAFAVISLIPCPLLFPAPAAYPAAVPVFDTYLTLGIISMSMGKQDR
jgi:hypothetical protein